MLFDIAKITIINTMNTISSSFEINVVLHPGTIEELKRIE